MQADVAFPFTERDEPVARARIERDLRRIVERVAQADPTTTALVLTGGFSRGEGTVRDGAPVNDYDLVAVRTRPGSGALRPVAHELTHELGIEVDLMPIWRARLPLVGRKLFWLDLRLGGRVVGGDPRALERLRRFGPEEVHPREIARLLANRAAGLLLATTQPEVRDLQAVKALLAAMDARLLRRGVYAPRLRERLDLSRAEPDHALFAAAVEWKLTGDVALPPDVWSQARDALLRAVAETGAATSADGPVEHAFHLLRARRLALHPSRRIRHEAWRALRTPETVDVSAFFTRRAMTLQ